MTKTSTSYTPSHKILAQIFSQTRLSCWKTMTSIFFFVWYISYSHRFLCQETVYLSRFKLSSFSHGYRGHFSGGRTNDSVFLNLYFKWNWLLEWAKPFWKISSLENIFTPEEYTKGFFLNREGEYLIPYGFRDKYRCQQQVLGTFKHSEDSYIVTGFFTICRYAVNWEEWPLIPFSKCFLWSLADTKEARKSFVLSLPLLSWVRVPSALSETLFEENNLMLPSPLSRVADSSFQKMFRSMSLVMPVAQRLQQLLLQCYLGNTGVGKCPGQISLKELTSLPKQSKTSSSKHPQQDLSWPQWVLRSGELTGKWKPITYRYTPLVPTAQHHISVV